MTSVLQKLFTQEIHGVGVLSEDHRLLVAVLVKLGEGALQAFELAVRWQLADVDKEALNISLLFGGEGLAFEMLGSLGGQARARNLSPEELSEIAGKAAQGAVGPCQVYDREYRGKALTW